MSIIHPSECNGVELEALEKSVAEDFAGVPAQKVLSDCVLGDAQLWRVCINDVTRGILVTQVRTWPRGQELYVWHMGGEGILAVMESVQGRLEEFAKETHCKWIRSLSRMGAGKLMKKMGYEVNAWMMLKELEVSNGI